jgi:hypothetical protein
VGLDLVGPVLNALDAFGWIIPALALTVLLLGAIALVAWCLEDLPFEPEIFDAIGGIFRWTRESWRGQRADLNLKG